VAVGDFTGDGIQDLAFTNFTFGTVSVLLGNGDGTFGAAQAYTAGYSAYAVAVGDFNGDGLPDLAVGDLSGGTVTVLLNAADGASGRPITTAPHHRPNPRPTIPGQPIVSFLVVPEATHAPAPLSPTGRDQPTFVVSPQPASAGTAPREQSLTPHLHVLQAATRSAADAAFAGWADPLADGLITDG
jgi:hypothetical protein